MMRFLDFLFPPRVDEIAVRKVSVDAFLALVVPRVVPETRPETVAILSFANERVRAAIHEAKYHGSSRAFELLATALADYLRDADDGYRKPLIIPVPLGAARRKERGFNQVEEIAQRAANELGIPVDTTLLIRTRETTSQVSLQRREREKNMRGAFGAAHSIDPSHTYIVIDDVITTGATLQSAIDTLAGAGAKRIISLALAH
ncbi:MAG: phosphoribosyltransferase family protein [Candidatus Paceibacterota bacterium]|jgi:ComF family protein